MTDILDKSIITFFISLVGIHTLKLALRSTTSPSFNMAFLNEGLSPQGRKWATFLYCMHTQEDLAPGLGELQPLQKYIFYEVHLQKLISSPPNFFLFFVLSSTLIFFFFVSPMHAHITWQENSKNNIVVTYVTCFTHLFEIKSSYIHMMGVFGKPFSHLFSFLS